ncbi:hypothetical protein BS78_04G175200 [Paspalum vaginatum]|nr:hypothetical protein BS78_04G175200 [Paspalum vaginatum]
MAGESSSWLPLDLLLEILARSDPVTIVRGDATCKLLRLHVTGADFRGRLLQRPADERFLVGLFYRRHRGHKVRVSPLTSAAAASPSHRPPIPVASLMSRTCSDDLFDSHRVVASSDGLLVLTTRRPARFGEPERPCRVCVCNPATGERAFFPVPTTVSGDLYVLLPLQDRDDDGRRAVELSSFRLLAADQRALRTQTLSSVEGRWSPVTTSPDIPILSHCFTEPRQQFPVVLGGGGGGGGGIWLYRQVLMRIYHVVALDVRTGQATSIDVPGACVRSLSASCGSKDLIVAAVDGELGLIVADPLVIYVWKLPGDAAAGCCWARSVLIQTDMILSSVQHLLSRLACQGIAFEWFGQRSGSLVFQMHGVGLLVFNLRSKRIYQLETCLRMASFDLFCPYELDRLSLIPSSPVIPR